MNLYETAIRLSSPLRHGALVLSAGDVRVSTQLSGNSQETVLDAAVTALTVLFIDDYQSSPDITKPYSKSDLEHWLVCACVPFLRSSLISLQSSGYALIASVHDTNVYLKHGYGPMMPDTVVSCFRRLVFSPSSLSLGKPQ